MQNGLRVDAYNRVFEEHGLADEAQLGVYVDGHLRSINLSEYFHQIIVFYFLGSESVQSLHLVDSHAKSLDVRLVVLFETVDHLWAHLERRAAQGTGCKRLANDLGYAHVR